MSKVRVVIVDDHAILREGIRSLLSGDPDIEVVGEGADGKDALRLVDELQPDAVLMDIAMPGMTGIDATRKIKEHHPEVTVLILSMHDSEEYVLPILRAGAAGYVLKRTAARELISALKAAVQGHTILHPDVARTVVQHLGAETVAGAAAADGGRVRARPERPERSGRTDAPPPEYLTDREREVLVLVAQGLTNQQIANTLLISVKTVQAHRANIMEKLDLHDAVELTKYAIRHGLVSLDD